METKKKIIQIVISKLIASSKRDRFIELTKQMNNWFLTQDGFVSYEAYENNLNLADKIVYKNKESAKRINKMFMETEIAKEMLTLVEPGYSSFIGENINL